MQRQKQRPRERNHLTEKAQKKANRCAGTETEKHPEVSETDKCIVRERHTETETGREDKNRKGGGREGERERETEGERG
jgi:hypothetical protein